LKLAGLGIRNRFYKRTASVFIIFGLLAV